MDSGCGTGLAGKRDEPVGSVRAEAACRVAGVRFIHQGAEVTWIRVRSQLPRPLLDALLLVDRMRRRRPQGVATRGIDTRHEIGGPLIVREEGVAIEFLGDVRGEPAET